MIDCYINAIFHVNTAQRGAILGKLAMEECNEWWYFRCVQLTKEAGFTKADLTLCSRPSFLFSVDNRPTYTSRTGLYLLFFTYRSFHWSLTSMQFVLNNMLLIKLYKANIKSSPAFRRLQETPYFKHLLYVVFNPYANSSH